MSGSEDANTYLFGFDNLTTSWGVEATPVHVGDKFGQADCAEGVPFVVWRVETERQIELFNNGHDVSPPGRKMKMPWFATPSSAIVNRMDPETFDNPAQAPDEGLLVARTVCAIPAEPEKKSPEYGIELEGNWGGEWPEFAWYESYHPSEAMGFKIERIPSVGDQASPINTTLDPLSSIGLTDYATSEDLTEFRYGERGWPGKGTPQQLQDGIKPEDGSNIGGELAEMAGGGGGGGEGSGGSTADTASSSEPEPQPQPQPSPSEAESASQSASGVAGTNGWQKVRETSAATVWGASDGDEQHYVVARDQDFGDGWEAVHLSSDPGRAVEDAGVADVIDFNLRDQQAAEELALDWMQEHPASDYVDDIQPQPSQQTSGGQEAASGGAQSVQQSGGTTDINTIEEADIDIENADITIEKVTDPRVEGGNVTVDTKEVEVSEGGVESVKQEVEENIDQKLAEAEEVEADDAPGEGTTLGDFEDAGSSSTDTSDDEDDGWRDDEDDVSEADIERAKEFDTSSWNDFNSDCLSQDDFDATDCGNLWNALKERGLTGGGEGNENSADDAEDGEDEDVAPADTVDYDPESIADDDLDREFTTDWEHEDMVIVTQPGCPDCQAMKEQEDIAQMLESGELEEVQKGHPDWMAILEDLETDQLPALGVYDETMDGFVPV